MALKDGYGIVPTKGRDVARALIKIADELGIDQHEITSSIAGYTVPVAILDAYTGPVETNKVSDIPVLAPIVIDTTIEGEEGVFVEAKPAHEPTDPGVFNQGTGLEDTAKATTAEEPAKNASTEDWEAWAATNHGYDVTEGLTRGDIIAKFSSK